MSQSPGPGPVIGRGIVKGAVVLGAAAVVSKLLGTLQKIPLQNIAGDYVFGIYNAVYPLYMLLLVLATAGFPVAVAKLVAEERAGGRPEQAANVLRAALVLSIGIGIVCFAVLYGSADVLAGLIGNPETDAAIRSISFALLLVPAMASLRGYFQGLHQMQQTAVSQVIEQLARVSVMVALLLLSVSAGYSGAAVAAGATFGSTAGAAAGLLFMLVCWRRHRKRAGSGVHAPDPAAAAAKRGYYRRLISYAVPICLGAVVAPILTITDTFTLPRLLASNGYGAIEAMTEFGLYNHGLPLVQLAAMIVSSVSVALVPAIAEAKARGEHSSIRAIAEPSIRLTWLIGLAVSAGLAVTAVSLNVMFYDDASGSDVIVILGFTAVFSVVQIVSGAILQGIGAERATAYHLLAAAAVKLALNIALVPLWGIRGAAAAAVAAYAVAAALNMLRLRRFGIRLPWWKPGPIFAAAGMAAIAACLLHGADYVLQAALPDLSYRVRQTAAALLAVLGGAAAFAVLAFRTRAVGTDELNAVPKLGAKLVPLLQRWHVLPYKGDSSCKQRSSSSD